MTENKDTREEVTPKQPATSTPKPNEEVVIADEQLDQVAGGINPQPLPPRHMPTSEIHVTKLMDS